MRLLLDTHVFLALIEPGARRLPADVAALLRDRESEHCLSAASLWEIAIKSRLGKLRLAVRLGALPELLDGLGVTIVASTNAMRWRRLSPNRRLATHSTACFWRNVRSRD